MKIRQRKISEVHPYPENPRKIPDKAVDAVARSIEEFGFRQPIVVDADGVVIIGHTRLQAAAKLGLKTVPVHVAEGLDPDKARALRLADNKTSELAQWDDDKLLAELGALRDVDFSGLDALGFDAPAPAAGRTTGGDEIIDPPKKPITRPGDVWRLGHHRLMCGDCTNPDHVAALFEGEHPDLTLTDPPYCSGGFQESTRAAGSVGTTADHDHLVNDRLSTRGYQALIRSALSLARSTYLYCFTDWRMWVNLFDVAEASGFGVRSMIVWNKETPGMGRGWRSQHEIILWACKDTPPFDKHASGVGNVITLARTGNPLHTTQKPLELISRLLANTPFAETVYDPFAGSGTVVMAADALGRRSYAMEIFPAYVDVAVQRARDAGLDVERVIEVDAVGV